MRHLGHLISQLGIHVHKCTGFDGTTGILANRWNTDNGAQYVDETGNILCPNNECELSGFHYFPSSLPKLDEDYNCNAVLCGWKTKGYGIFYGKRQCGWDDRDLIVNCLTRFHYELDGFSSTIRPTNLVVDMPDIISRHFSSIKKQFQSAQPCTTLFKVEYEINIIL